MCYVAHTAGADQLGPQENIIGIIAHLRNDYDKDALHEDEDGKKSTLTNEAWLHREYENLVRNHVMSA